MASVTITPVADALASLLEGIAVTPALKVYRYAPRDLDKVPCAVVEVPRAERTRPDQAESQINADDWTLTFDVSLYFDLAEAMASQVQAAEYFEAFVSAVDHAPTLGNTVFDAKVVSSEPKLDEINKARPLFVIECVVEALVLVAP